MIHRNRRGHDMARTASIKSIETQIRKLQEKAEKLKRNQKAPQLAEIVRRMKASGITLEELQAALASRPRRAAKATKSDAKAATERKPVPAKYRNAETGETWTGRGRAPRWLATAETAGRKREEFLV